MSGWTDGIGFDFRSTLAYVTDPSNSIFITSPTNDATYTYPKTATINGVSVTFGWDLNGDTVQTRDRNNGIDPRLSGWDGNDGNGSATSLVRFRVDLPSAGKYNVTLACGDASNDQSQYIKVLDTSTALLTYAAIATASGSFMDATGAVYSAANWPGSNTAESLTFATTIFHLQIGPDSATGSASSMAAYLFLQQQPAVVTGPLPGMAESDDIPVYRQDIVVGY